MFLDLEGFLIKIRLLIFLECGKTFEVLKMNSEP
jgi:hypothetical protein